MNKILKILVSVDFIVLSAFGFLGPIYAVFLNKNIEGGTLASIGVASAIYLIAKSSFQIIVAKFNDAEKGNKRELYTMFTGYLLFSIVPIFYIFAKTIEHIYIIEFFFGLFAALGYPGWFTLYTRYVDKEQEGYQWSVHDIGVNLGMAITAALGGLIAETWNFNILFILISICSAAGSLLILYLFNTAVLNNHHKK